MAADRHIFNLKWGKENMYGIEVPSAYIYPALIARSLKENYEFGFPKHLVTKYVTNKRVMKL